MTNSTQPVSLTAPLSADGIEHGTERGYRKCRPACDACREANRIAQAARRARRLATPIPDELHGKASTYTDRGCRCELCSLAANGAPAYKPPTRDEQTRASEAALGADRVRIVRYEYPIHPEPAVEQTLRQVIGASRFVYNSYVSFIRDHKKEHGRYPASSRGQSSALITQPRRNEDTSWMRDIPYAVLSNALRHGQAALSAHISSLSGQRKGPRVGAPTYKRKGHGGSAHFSAENFRIQDGWQNTGPRGGRLHLGSHLGDVHVRWTRPLPSMPSAVTIIQRPTGAWYASFLVRVPVATSTPQAPGQVVGIDLGLEHFAVLAYSSGRVERIENPRLLSEEERKLARMQKDLARKERPRAGQPASKRWEEQRVRVARQHQRVADRRLNFTRTLAARLIRENQAIVVESLNIAGLGKTRMGKSVHDAGWGIFLRVLKEGAENRGRDLFVLPPFFAGTRTCSMCGHNGGPKPLNVRQWECSNCGARLDRDINAAANHLRHAFDRAMSAEDNNLAAGLADRINARGWDMRRTLSMLNDAGPCEARSHRTAQSRPAQRRNSRRSTPRRKHVRDDSPSALVPRNDAEYEAAGGKSDGRRRNTFGTVVDEARKTGAR
ncbi:RNA-guided endonuclease InsQ/TnpB family protein [Microbacterium sp. Mcb102]|uniref:RNA-guided endonuclease InsQ/TnpB family protein n=1 Tax=Microbacterium sp. Mcb102 TaxID=2926012 RepID=UPI0021CADB4C|nr:transposase [Microbacterium sp. Mcb102]